MSLKGLSQANSVLKYKYNVSKGIIAMANG